MMRDALATIEYWIKWINFEGDAISKRIKLIGEPSKNLSYEPQYVRDLAFKHVKLALRHYSLGVPVNQLLQYFDSLIHYWEESERLGKEVWTPEQQRIRHTWSINLDFYIDCFWLVGLALALEIPESQWHRLIVLIGNDGQDELLDRIIKTRSPHRRVGDSLCYPKPYAQLLKAADAKVSAQPALLAKFVSYWYQDVGSAARSGREKQAVPYKKPYWHSYHSPMKGAYFGYWCLEAVAAVKAFGLDDSQCVGHPHYPGDLLRRDVVTPPDMSRLLPELAATIGAPPQPPFTGEPRTITTWEAFKLLVKNKFGK